MFGILVAWVLVRYQFPGKRCSTRWSICRSRCRRPSRASRSPRIYAPNGWIGQPLLALGIHAAYTRIGIVIALTFIGLPFVVRTVQPVLEDLDTELEEAAASLGASRWQTFTRVLLPTILPAAITGFALAFARAIGEYGSVIFIAGNMPMNTEITPLLIITKLEQYDYAGATAIAVVMLVVSFAAAAARSTCCRSGSGGREHGPKRVPGARLKSIRGQALCRRRTSQAAAAHARDVRAACVRWLLIAIAVSFLVAVSLPAAGVVFGTAFAKGVACRTSQRFSDPGHAVGRST